MGRERRPEREPGSGAPRAAPQGGGCGRCGPGPRDLNRPDPPEECSGVPLVQVGFKGHRIDLCVPPEEGPPPVGRSVLVEADRGLDIGILVRLDRGCLQPSRKNPPRRILREAQVEELEQVDRLREEEKEALRVCRERVACFGLPMQTVDAEYQFDRKRVTFYFTAEGRVDFRELVRDLARIFRTRIELRQIPPRESARRQGGVGPCGRTLCCASFLQGFEPVTLKSAKRQNLSLAPQRISGLCGRLLCCLNFDGSCPRREKTEAGEEEP